MWGCFGPIIRGDWVWEWTSSCSIISTMPEENQSWLRSCPFEAGRPYGDAIIESVRTTLLSTGWVWVIALREPEPEEFQTFWAAIGAFPKPKNCQWPEVDEDGYVLDWDPVNDPVYTWKELDA